ncbi:hypothetical protein L210DRAFT_3579211 [Boletus edulis BED1]|uniref:Uncharacterized protein n=1 Tax=Boletus edulis BED1 TaxID=1328754 RepID=A0AAD4G614_BOLED|nr:hypothetical protein L210DRAFT_3579211 [Boletus edulis BED1]
MSLALVRSSTVLGSTSQDSGRLVPTDSDRHVGLATHELGLAMVKFFSRSLSIMHSEPRIPWAYPAAVFVIRLVCYLGIAYITHAAQGSRSFDVCNCAETFWLPCP